MFKQFPFFLKKGFTISISLFVGLILFSVFCACKRPTPPAYDSEVAVQQNKTKEYPFKYDLESPDVTFKLEKELREISGLSIDDEEKYLWAVQDENAIIYKISLETGKVVEKKSFWKDGDYEGIEKVGSDIFVLKNSGTIYKVSNVGQKTQAVEKFNTPLGKANNVEGLGYDSKNNRLLLACKGNCKIDPKGIEMERAIYAFDLDSMKLEKKPAFVIHIKDVQDYLNTTPAVRDLEKLSEYFQPGGTNFIFSPSAIAIHPMTGEIFITSATKKILAVLSPEGKILHIEKMKKKIHPQPEGLCFTSDGTLFIANEGKDGRGMIHRFSMKRKMN